jgi:transposase
MLTLTEVQQGRDVAIGIGSIWRFFDREGISFKKNAAAIRTGQARRRAKKGKLEKTSGKG